MIFILFQKLAFIEIRTFSIKSANDNDYAKIRIKSKHFKLWVELNLKQENVELIFQNIEFNISIAIPDDIIQIYYTDVITENVDLAATFIQMK